MRTSRVCACRVRRHCATARVRGAIAHHSRDATACRKPVKGQPEVLLDVANDEADDAKQHDEDLEEPFTVQLPLEIHGASSLRGWRPAAHEVAEDRGGHGACGDRPD